MTAPPPSVRVFACGASGTGKTRTLLDLWGRRSPRLLLVDTTGEHVRAAGRGQVVAGDFAELLRCLRRVAGRPRWQIVAQLDDTEFAQLAALLMPPKRLRRPSLALQLGGLAVLHDEIAAVAPHGAPAPVLDLWRRGRHVGLSLYAGTQRPADCARIVTSQSRWLVVCRLFEPNDVAYLRSVLTADALAAALQLPEYGALIWQTFERRGWVVDARRRVLRRLAPLPLTPPNLPHG